MKISIVDNGVTLTLTGQEVVILIEELSDVPGGSKLRKVKQLYDELQQARTWIAHGAGGYSNETGDERIPSYAPPRRGRPPKKLQLAPTAVQVEDPLSDFVRSRLGHSGDGE